MGIVLDSSLFIAHERGQFNLPAFVQLSYAGVTTYITSVIASELLHGWERAPVGKRKDARKAYIEQVFTDTPILDFELATARYHANLWAWLATRGQLMNGHDVLIAASCLTHGHDIATLNHKDFARIPNLTLRNVEPYHISS